MVRVKIRTSPFRAAVAAALLFATGSAAQPVDPLRGTSDQPIGQATARPLGYRPSALGPEDRETFMTALEAIRAKDFSSAEAARLSLRDPVARQTIVWLEADQTPEQMSFLQLDAARRDLSAWPRAAQRQANAEKAMETASIEPDRVIAWFDGAPPRTAEGALTLASALQAKGREPEARALIARFWREELFDADIQARILARFPGWLSTDDHVQRLRLLVLGPQGPATTALLAFLPADYQALVEAARALRADRSDANALFAAVPASVASDPSLAFERARFLRKRNLETLAFPLLAKFPPSPADEAIADRIWLERRNFFNAAIRAGDARAAYSAMANHGFRSGERMVEAEFFAGWAALKKLRDPVLADRHFASLQASSSTPITQGRANFWRAQAAEARGDKQAAQAFYEAGARYVTAFYGQLCAEKAGVTRISLPADPTPTPEDRARFDARAPVLAARMLAEANQKDLFRLFVLAIDDTLPSGAELALLFDLARYYNDQDLAMRVARAATQRGFLLAERGYPIVRPPQIAGAAETAFSLSIARQESNFYPAARSAPGARGVMQLMPATARGVARRLGLPYSDEKLYDPEFNMTLGSYHLGELLDQYGGSYAMAAAGYNAGPLRPPTWASECGDPRGGGSDPLDFIECIPFAETRNYVMRTLETTQIYRARLNGGSAPLTLSQDLKRGAYGYSPPSPSPAAAASPPANP